MGKSVAEGMQKGFEEMTQTSRSQPDVTPQRQETAGTSETREQIEAEDLQKNRLETTQMGVVQPEITPQKQETSVIDEKAKRELFLKDNIVRLAEVEFPDNKGILWNILSFDHKAHLTYIEVEPTPATLEYHVINLSYPLKILKYRVL